MKQAFMWFLLVQIRREDWRAKKGTEKLFRIVVRVNGQEKKFQRLFWAERYARQAKELGCDVAMELEVT